MELVVDASGQGSRAPRWLERSATANRGRGRGRPPRVRDPVVQDARGWEGISVLPGWPDNPRGGTVRRVEGGVWAATLIVLGGDYPPTDGEAFLAFAQSLPSPAIDDAIKTPSPSRPSTPTVEPPTAAASTRRRAFLRASS